MTDHRLPRFDRDAVLVLTGPGGRQTWTGDCWNTYADAAERNKTLVPYRFVTISNPERKETDRA